MSKKISLIFVTLTLINTALLSQVKEYIPIVRPILYEQTKKTYESIADKFEKDDYKELAEIFRSFAMGGHGSGFVFVDKDGENYILTNQHVVSNSEYVNLEFSDKGNTKKIYEHCPILYLDNEIDLAVIKFPNNEKVFSNSFAISTDKQPDGKEIWSAGFPGLLGKPMWQFAKGNITNEEAYIEELVSPDITYLIQHSASIDPGNSGGPLLVKDENLKNAYTVVGINTWSISNRQNTFFSIPSKNIYTVLKKAKTITASSENADSLKAMLTRQCLAFATEIDKEKPDWRKINNLISYTFVANTGWDSFLKVLGEENEEVNNTLEKVFLEQSPVEAMKHAISYRIWSNLYQVYKSELSIAFKEISLMDEELVEKSKIIKTTYLVNGATHELEWMFEHGHWKINYYDLDKRSSYKENPEVESYKKKKHEVSSPYFSVDAVFTPLTYFPDKILNQNFNLMGIGGGLSVTFADRIAIYAHVNSLMINDKMENPPANLTDASVKYFHANLGGKLYFVRGKVCPYVLLGFNYMKFSETGANEDITITNEYDKYGIQAGLGIKFRIVRFMNLFSEFTYNSDYLIPFLFEDFSYDEELNNHNLSVMHVSAGLSFDIKKK